MGRFSPTCSGLASGGGHITLEKEKFLLDVYLDPQGKELRIRRDLSGGVSISTVLRLQAKSGISWAGLKAMSPA